MVKPVMERELVAVDRCSFCNYPMPAHSDICVAWHNQRGTKPPVATDTDIVKHMANRFLGWRLPENFNPDAGISFKPTFNDHLPEPMKHQPTGTNLFDATQAEAMVRHMIEGLPITALHTLNSDEDALRGALEEFGAHKHDCKWISSGAPELANCQCGWLQKRRDLSKTGDEERREGLRLLAKRSAGFRLRIEAALEILHDSSKPTPDRVRDAKQALATEERP